MKKNIGVLHVLTDTVIQHRFTHMQLAELVCLRQTGGADTIQFREKKASTHDLIEMATAIRKICADAAVTFLVNDRVDVALACDADGVHLGQQDLPISVARKILGPDKIIGGTAANLEQALQVEQEGADYLGFGHIFATQSKEKSTSPKGPDELRKICEAVSIPVIAIGGINLSNIDQVLNAGAWGVAVIGAVCAQDDPQSAVKQLKDRVLSLSKDAINKALSSRKMILANES